MGRVVCENSNVHTIKIYKIRNRNRCSYCLNFTSQIDKLKMSTRKSCLRCYLLMTLLLREVRKRRWKNMAREGVPHARKNVRANRSMLCDCKWNRGSRRVPTTFVRIDKDIVHRQDLMIHHTLWKIQIKMIKMLLSRRRR